MVAVVKIVTLFVVEYVIVRLLINEIHNYRRMRNDKV